MSVLSNTEIVKALDGGRLMIEPRPEPGPDQANTPYNAVSVDLRLASEFNIPKDDLGLAFDPSGTTKMAHTLRTIYETEEIPVGQSKRLESGKFILGKTMEKVTLPLVKNCLAARIEGRSSLARQGLIVHFTAPTIHTKFSGAITLEMINLGKLPILLTPGMYICQLIVETVMGVPTKVRPSQFQNQKTPAG